jgi:uncharacterized membrane protein SpoIIM required for sporulation
VISNRWIDTRKPHWTRLEQLARQAESSGLKTLSAGELRDLGLLYRQAAADLSAVRTDAASRTLEAYLNRLVARAHNFVYAGGRISPRSIGRYLAYEYPRLFRRLFPYTALAFLLLTLAGLFGAMLTILRPDYMVATLGPAMIDTIHHHKMWTESILGAEPQSSSFIMTNNITVCFLTFAAGITAGLFTIYLLIQNGLSIGIVAVACHQNGLSLSLWSFVAAHGALELPCIFIAGGAGLRLGAGILFPGCLRRRDSIVLAGREAVRLVAVTVPLLMVAGTLEGFLSPSHAPVALKFSVSAVLLTALSLWLSEGWRRRRVKERGPLADPGEASSCRTHPTAIGH